MDTNPSPAAGSLPQVQLLGTEDGEPQEVVIENVGFLALNGDTKVRILPKGYDLDSLPLSSASLLSIANRSGLFAAAAHSDLVVGSTVSIHEAFSSTSERVANYRPKLSLSLAASISHVAFTADESHLVLGSASGGLVVYSVNDLSKSSGSVQPLFELGTDGVGLRELKPNPATPEFVAVVTTGGNVQMVNINTKGWEQGLNGPVLKTGASTVAWSPRGVQIICGMGDGTGWQMTPQGEVKAVLPSVPGLTNYFVSSIVWLENNLFITTHTLVPSDPQNNDSVFHTLTRAGSSFQYTRLPDPVPPFGLESRSPPYFFHALIKQYAPSMKDMVIFSSTCSADIGLVGRFSTPISGESPVPAGTWITSSIGDDTRRAQLPLPLSGDSVADTSPIGMALDLSNKENVKRPVGGEEIEESPGPLPILMVLNHEGLLCAWHVVYNDAIEKGEKYTGMMVYTSQGQQQQQQQQQQPQRPSTPPSRPTAFAGVIGSPQASTKTPFGGFGSTGPSSFGLKPGSSTLPSGVFGNLRSSPAVKSPAFGAPSFGTPSMSIGSAFANAASSGPTAATVTQTAFSQPPALGGTPSQFAQVSASGPATSTPAFGAPTSLGLGKGTVPGFGQPTQLGNAGGLSTNLSSGFSAYADKGGFAAAASAVTPSNGAPIWSTTTGKGLNTEGASSVFMPTNTASSFGSVTLGGFRISSGFQPDGSAANDMKKPVAESSFGLGGGFRDALGTSQATPRGLNDQSSKDADMDSDVEQDNVSDGDDDDDIVPPTARLQGGPPQMAPVTPHSGTIGSIENLPRGIFANASALANSSPFVKPAGSQSPFGQPTTAAPQSSQSPFGATSSSPSAHAKSAFAPLPSSTTTPSSFANPTKPLAPAFGSTSFGAFAPKPQTAEVTPPTKPSPPVTKEPSPEAAPLPPDFTLPKTKTEPDKEVVPDEPLPLGFTTPKKEIKEPSAGDVPLPSDITAAEVNKQGLHIEDVPLPPDFTAAPKTEIKNDSSLGSVTIEDAPLDLTAGVEKESKLKDFPSLPEDELEDDKGVEEKEGIDDKVAYEEEEEGGAGEGEEQNNGYDEEEYGEDDEDEDEDEEDEDEDEEDEDEDEDEEDEDEDEDGDGDGDGDGGEGEGEGEEGEEEGLARSGSLSNGQRFTAPKDKPFEYNPKPKLSSTSPSTSSVFGAHASFKETIGTVDKAAPFANLFGSKPTASREPDHGKTPPKPNTSTSGGAKGRSSAHGPTPPSGKDKRLGSGVSGGMFNKMKKPGVSDIGRVVSTPASASGSSFFPTPTPTVVPASSMFSTASNRSSSSALSSGSPPVSVPSGLPGFATPMAGRPPPSLSPRPATAPSLGGMSSLSAAQSVRSSPLGATSLPVQQTPKAEELEEPREDSDLDLDKEFSDQEDEKIRRKLQKGKVKPLENLPKIKSIGEIEVANDFNAVFDSIYLSGNMMVNRLGLTVRGLAAYHMAQSQPLADVTHESAKDMKQPKDWKLCELEKVRKILEELVDGVKKENKGNKDLEAQYEAANKGFIKLDTKDAEIKRLLAVHNDAQTATMARARPLIPEQLIQQRKLRKEYTRIEKLLKDAEKEVTQLKAKIASRNENNTGVVVPPTVEAVRNTIMKLTGMVERKNSDIEYLEERLRRVKLKSRSASATPGRSRGMTPERSMRGETPQRFSTPERGLGNSLYAPTPVLAVTDPIDVAEAKEEMKARREMGKKLRSVLEKSGPRMTGGQGQQGQGYGMRR